MKNLLAVQDCFDSALVDVSDFPPTAIENLPQNALGMALRAILAQPDEANVICSGSYLEGLLVISYDEVAY